MRTALEALMYLAFSVAALPMAWLGVREVLVYRAHPDQLADRDAALLVFAAMGALQVMTVALALAAILAVYFLLKGKKAVRYSIAALIGSWALVFCVGWFFIPSTRLASMARLYWDAVPFVVLVLVPWVCAGVRLARPGGRRRS
jgi:hypothetical protein